MRNWRPREKSATKLYHGKGDAENKRSACCAAGKAATRPMETPPATKPWFSKRVTLLCVLVVSAVGMVASLRRRKPSALQDAGQDLQNLCERLGLRCPTATSRCPDGYSGPHCQTEAPWLALAYGFDVDPDSPYFIRKTSKIFHISSDDVDVTPERYADGETVYSTIERTVAEDMAAKMGVAGYFGAFSAAARLCLLAQNLPSKPSG